MGRFNFGKAMKAAVKDGTLEKAVDKMEADLAAEEEEATTTATAELPLSDQNLVVRCPPRSASSSPTIRGSAQITPMPLLRLSAFDRLVAGRTVPMIWYYRTTLNKLSFAVISSNMGEEWTELPNDEGKGEGSKGEGSKGEGD